MKLKIPDIAIEGLIRLYEMNDEELQRVHDILESVKPEMNWKSLRAQIADEDSQKIVEAIRGLYDFRLRTGKKIEELAEDVAESAMEEEFLKDKIIDKTKLSVRLKKALSFNPLGITAKAQDVMGEHQNVYVDGRILTDLRPVFCEDIDEGNPVTTIIHNLSINYIADDTMKKMVFALDSEDLDKLGEIIERAKGKEKRMKDICSESGIKCLR